MRPSRSASSHSAGRIQSSPARGGVAFVEDQVDHFEHRREPRARARAARHLERHARLGERALGAHDALRDGRLGHQKGARDLVGGEAAEQAQRERDARLGGEHRMAGDEDQPQQVVADVVVQRPLEIGHGASSLRRRQFAAELFVLALEQLVAPQLVDARDASRSPSARRRDCPGCPTRPLLQRGDQRVLRQLLGECRRRARCARGRR